MNICLSAKNTNKLVNLELTCQLNDNQAFYRNALINYVEEAAIRHLGMLHILEADQKNRIFDLCHLPINLSFALLSVADLFVGINSCILHAADLFRIPGVGIFVDTDPQEWGFRFAPHKHIYSDVINSIEPDQVINAMMSLS